MGKFHAHYSFSSEVITKKTFNFISNQSVTSLNLQRENAKFYIIRERKKLLN